MSGRDGLHLDCSVAQTRQAPRFCLLPLEPTDLFALLRVGLRILLVVVVDHDQPSAGHVEDPILVAAIVVPGTVSHVVRRNEQRRDALTRPIDWAGIAQRDGQVLGGDRNGGEQRQAASPERRLQRVHEVSPSGPHLCPDLAGISSPQPGFFVGRMARFSWPCSMCPRTARLRGPDCDQQIRQSRPSAVSTRRHHHLPGQTRR